VTHWPEPCVTPIYRVGTPKTRAGDAGDARIPCLSFYGMREALLDVGLEDTLTTTE
jgi:hypothetical protein